jgi:hypothetical protein
MSYVSRLIRVATNRYIDRDLPVPLDLTVRLHELGVYFDFEQEITDE